MDEKLVKEWLYSKVNELRRLQGAVETIINMIEAGEKTEPKV